MFDLAGTPAKAILLLLAATLMGVVAANAVSAQLPPETATIAVATPPSATGTPRPAGTPLRLSIEPAASPSSGPSGIANQIVGQQAAAQATIAVYASREATQATQVAELQAALVDARVTATALVVVAANIVLDPTRQTLTIQTDLAGMLTSSEDALAEARRQLSIALARYPIGCRAGFMLISGKAATIEQGVQLAERVDALLREFWPDIADESTGAEHFALPNEQPFGEVSIDIFFYSGCEPIS